MNLIFLGPPGAGKGTQAARLAAELDMRHISTGDMFRAAIREETPMGMKAKAFMDKGELVPDQVVIDMVREYLPRVDAKGGFILDGFPRTVQQAEALSGFATIDAVISFDLPDEEIVHRLSARRVCEACGKIISLTDAPGAAVCPACGGKLIQRPDDNADTIRHRLHVYHVQTEALINYYQSRGMLKSVSSEASVSETYARLRKALALAGS